MRRGKAGPRLPANPPRRTPLPPSPRLPCLRGQGERGAERRGKGRGEARRGARTPAGRPAAAAFAATCRSLPERGGERCGRPVPGTSRSGSPRGASERGAAHRPRRPRSPASAATYRSPVGPGHRRPRTPPPPPASSRSGRAAGSPPPRFSLALGAPLAATTGSARGCGSPTSPTAPQRAEGARAQAGPVRGCAASGREGQNGPTGRLWRQRDGERERAPGASAGNKGPENKCSEEKCRLRGFSFIPAPCALNSNLPIPSHCGVLRDLIISDFLLLPGWLPVGFASLSHIVQLLVWVSYYFF